MTGILMLDSLTRGNTLKQGDKTPLTYKLLDADGDKLDVAGKTATVRLVHPNYLTIGYEKTGLTVQSDDTVTFTIDKIIPARKYNVEIIVDNKFVFPSRSAESKFTIDRSSLGTESNIIEIVGKEVLINAVKSKVDAELQPLVTSLESAKQAEIQRVSVEASRVSAEAQRKTDHANRSAELAGKADKVVIKNLIANGDFSKGLTGFTPISPTRDKLEKTEKGLKVTSLIDANDLGFFMPKLNLTKGNSYYVYITHDSNSTRLQTADNMRFQSMSNSVQSVPLSYSDTLSSAKFNAISDFTYSYFSAGVRGSNPNQIKPGDAFTIKHLGVIDLTKTFGAGNEPTKEEMDELIKVTGYIDGEYALNNKEMLGHLMNGIHEKANKKQEDWITPTLLNGWTQQGQVYNTPAYRKNQFGTVEIRGILYTGTKDTIPFILPEGYRPTSQYYGVTRSQGQTIAMIDIDVNGRVLIGYYGSGYGWVSLSNISFDTV